MDAVIYVENLAKQYVIGQHHEQYATLRDLMADGLRRFSRRLTHPFSTHERRDDTELFWALQDINFQVRQGERIGIIGRNGAGKSTLLKILSRITEPTSGRVAIKGRVSSLLEVGTGFHPQLTGRENIFLNGAILGMSNSEIRRKFDEIVEFAEIEKFLDTPVKRYSSGMYVRLAFAVAAHLDPEILLLDEVLAVGDNQFQKKCLGKMEDVSTKEGRTILIVSHNMGTLKSLCTRAIVLKKGCVDFDGNAMAAVAHYSMREAINSAVVRWDVADAPSIPSGFLVEVGILNDGRNTGTDLSTEQTIQIYVVFQVTRESRVGTSVLLKNEEGMLVLVSISNHEPLWHGKVRPKGLYRSICEIPANFLADGRYNVSVPFWEGHYTAGIVEEDVLSFYAHERGLVRGDLPYEMRGGVVRPLLNWTSEYLGTDSTEYIVESCGSEGDA